MLGIVLFVLACATFSIYWIVINCECPTTAAIVEPLIVKNEYEMDTLIQNSVITSII